jgi:dolichyl-phosphate-mannose--protein O-mannosyl transferase
LFFSQRTIFTFYTVAFVPFVTLALAYGAGVLIGPARTAAFGGAVFRALWRRLGNTGFGAVVYETWRYRRPMAVLVVGVAVTLMLFVSAFFWPIWTAQSVPFQFWQMHMWFQSWV